MEKTNKNKTTTTNQKQNKQKQNTKQEKKNPFAVLEIDLLNRNEYSLFTN